MTAGGTPVRGFTQLEPLLRFNNQGLIPAVIQEYKSKRVLTLAYLNRDAVEKSLAEGLVYVFRRSLNKLMLKGETSGHIQRIRRVEVDCEGKSLVIQVSQHVAACHAGYLSCFYRGLKDGRLVIGERRVFDPDAVYRR
jgi:phosphoribosyl-AMP cyclohydrolase